MTDRLHIITTCSNRKRLPVPLELRARELSDVSVEERFETWRSRLHAATSPTAAAEAVYAGEHWLQSQRAVLRARSVGWNARLWVASAGHGLISSTRQISAYAATLALREPDAVAQTSPETRAWWAATTTLGVEADAPRHVAELVRRDPEARYLVVLSASYGDAMVHDLAAAATSLKCQGDLTILSGGWNAPPDLAPLLVAYDASIQGLLGGARQSLNARVAAWLLGRSQPASWDREYCRREIGALVRRAPVMESPSRERMTDREVRSFARAYIELERLPSASRALRHLRDSGRACEQRRFGELFRRELEVARG